MVDIRPEHLRAYGRRLREQVAGTSVNERTHLLNELIDYYVNNSEDALDNLRASINMGYGDKEDK